MRVTLTVLLGIVVLLGAGCTSIPERTRPKVVAELASGGDQFEVSAPKSGLSPIKVVRRFIINSGKPVNDHQAARVYLTEHARQTKQWPSSQTITIIKRQFNTVFALGDRSETDNRRTVVVSGTVVGRLSPDNAFIPSNSDDPLRVKVTVVRQPNGEWRIADPPNRIIMTKSALSENYRRVPLYFVAPTAPTLVPDLRYVPAKPSEDIPNKIVNLLLHGPSKALAGAVENPLGGKVALEGKVGTAPDGAVEVPLTHVQGKSRKERELMLAQLVLSLQDFIYGGVRPVVDDDRLVPGESAWRASELPAYGAASALSSELSGLFVLNGKVFSLADGKPIAGPAGSGAYRIRKAGQSISGDRLAVVERFEGGVRLRVGPTNEALGIVDLTGETMTAPTWHPSGSAVWTVVNGDKVVRVQRLSDGTWAPQTVKAADLTSMGEITALRLSRDGTRVAAVVDGQVVIASVIREGNSVSLRAPRVLQSEDLTKAVDVAWYNQHMVVVGTASTVTPVVRLPIDGLTISSYNSSNLVSTIQAVAAAPGRPVIAAGKQRMLTAENVNAIWRVHEYSRPGAIPFYPG